jgi:AraC family transcriptional activator of mtrCDE
LQGRLDVRCEFAAPWSADHARLPPGQAAYHIVLSGQCQVELPDLALSLRLSAGDVLLLPRGVRHLMRDAGCRPASPTGLGKLSVASAPQHRTQGWLPVKHNLGLAQEPDVDILCGVFEFPARRHGLLIEALPEHLVVSTADRPEFESLRGLLRLMAWESVQARPGGQAIVNQLSTALFALLLRAHLESQDLPPGALALLADAQLRTTLSAMLDDPAHDWTVAELAGLAHMSRPSFARSFAAMSGTTPIQMLTRLRMEQASALLQEGSYSVGEVADRVGYQSEAAFSRAFTRHAGTGPGKFRQQAGSNPALIADAAR